MGNAAETDRELTEIAGRQYGVVSTWQASAAGIGRKRLSVRNQSQRLFRVYRGSYSLTARVSREAIWVAGCLTAGEGSVLSHMSAAHLWGVTAQSGPTEVLRPKSAGHRSNCDAHWDGQPKAASTESGGRIPVLRIRSSRNLHPSEVTVLNGIPVTSVARMFVDICGSVPKGQLKGLLHEAAREGLLRFDELRAAMDRARGKKGVKVLREIIDDWDPQTSLTRNQFEVKCRNLYRKGNLPEPLVNRIVGGFEVDFFWASYMA